MKQAIDRMLDRIVETTDRVFDVPVEVTNQIFEIPADLAVPENRRYEKYRRGMHRVEAGAVLVVGGMASAAGITLLAGYGLIYWGGVKALWNAVQLDDYYQ